MSRCERVGQRHDDRAVPVDELARSAGDDLHERLLCRAYRATGDGGIVAVGDFLPKGTTWTSGGIGKQLLGRGIGASAISTHSPDHVEDHLAQVGLTGSARPLANKLSNPVIIVAASPNRLHLLVTESALHGPAHTEQLRPVTELARSELDVRIQQRLSVRTVLIRERSSGRTFALESKRFGRHVTNRLLRELRPFRF